MSFDIICTIGPSSVDYLPEMKDAGMTIGRLNMAHGDLNWHAKAARILRELDVPIMIDIPGIKTRPHEVISDNVAITRGIGLQASHFAFSFAHSADQIQKMKDRFRGISITPKIEDTLGMENLTEMTGVADSFILDRDDIISSIGRNRLLVTQATFLHLLYKSTAYIASGIMESMVDSPSPSQLEILDVQGLVRAGADGVVLTASTAIGKWPVTTVHMISALVNEE